MGYPFKITVGVPAYNEEWNLAALLENLSRQLANSEHDIVVVSDGSSDRTSAIVQELCRADNSVRLIIHPKRLGKAEAINSILSAAQGEVIVLVSGDTRPASGSINALLDLINTDPNVGLVWAWPTPIMPDSGVLVHLGEASYHLHQRFMSKLDQMDQLRHSAGELLAFRQGSIHRLPSDCVNDDAYLALATARNGLKVRLAKNIETKFVYPRNIPDYVEQRKRWLRGHFQMKRMTGEFPHVLEFNLTRQPKLALEVLMEELKQCPRNLLYLTAAILLEIVALGSIILDALLTKRHIGWRTIESTKRFPRTYPSRSSPGEHSHPAMQPES